MSQDPNERYSAREAYYFAFSIYSFKYLQVTSIISTLQCLLRIPSYVSYFKREKIETILQNDYYHNGNKKYLITFGFKNIVNNIDQTNYNFKTAEKESLRLRIFMYANKERIESSPEIDPSTFLSDLLNKMHQEMNNSKEVFKEENIDKSNENAVINSAIKKFMICCRSKISDLFFYIIEFVYECTNCQTIMNCTCEFMLMCPLSPYRASIYLNKRDLNIIDLFKHFKKIRLT